MSSGPHMWREVTLGDILRLRRERSYGTEQLLSVTQDRGIVRQQDVGRRDSSSDDKSTYWRVYPGDIVYNTMRMWQGVVGYSEFDGIVSPAYTVCQPQASVSSRFMAYMLKHPQMVAGSYRLSQGLVSDTWNLRYSAFSTIKARIPELGEQQRIAEILDSMDHQIEAEEELLAKVRAMHKGILYDVMTKGVNGSGASWSSVPCRVAFSLASGLPYALAQPDGDGSVPIYGSSGPAGFGRKALSSGPTFVIGRVGEGGVGSVYYLPEPSWITDNALWARRIDPGWLTEFIAEYLSWLDLRRLRSQTGQPLVTQGVIGECPLVKPDVNEQRTIVEILREWSSHECTIEKRLGKLRLLKQGLMDDLLMGRARVMGGGMERVRAG